MLSRFRLLPIMFILLAVLLVGLPVAAQDLVTNTPAGEAAATAEVTAPAPTGVPSQQPSIFSPALIGELLLFLGLSAFAGGGIVAILLSFLGRKEVRDRVEAARDSWSPQQQEVLANFTTLYERMTGGILDFLKAVQDGQPNGPIAQLTAMEGPALATKGEIEFLSEQLALHQKHYPLPVNHITVNASTVEEGRAVGAAVMEALNRTAHETT